MADFLTRLVHRTLGQAPIVQPRIGSIFESGLEMLGVSGFGQFWVREIGVKKLLV